MIGYKGGFFPSFSFAQRGGFSGFCMMIPRQFFEYPGTHNAQNGLFRAVKIAR